MEPPVAVALYREDGRFEIWSPTQGPELAQHYVGMYLLEPDQRKWLLWQVVEPSEIAKDCEREPQRAFNELVGQIMGVDQPTLLKMRDDFKTSIRDRVKLHVTLLGGGFGRKSKPDYVVEAAFLAKQYPGVPIRVQWTREDDIQFSYYNAVSHQYLKAALGADGRPTAFLQRSAFTSFFATHLPYPAGGSGPRHERHSSRKRAPRSTAAANTSTARASSARRASRTCRSTCRQPAHRELPGPELTSASAGCARWPTSTTPSASAPSPTSWRSPPDATPRTTCSS